MNPERRRLVMNASHAAPGACARAEGGPSATCLASILQISELAYIRMNMMMQSELLSGSDVGT
jgi:hypothetical protein